MSNWVCYLLKSTDSNKTYVGATDDLYRRLCDHNGLHGVSKGAKATKGEMWYPFICISGFPSKIACLSFESGVRRVRRRRCKHKYKYPTNVSSIQRRLIDIYNLLYVGSPLKKWHPYGLTLNWLEPEYKLPNLILPVGTHEITDFHQMRL